MCWLCGRRITPGQPWDIDHVQPRSAGGAVWDLGNMAAAHASCNRSRGARAAPAPPAWKL
jgi:5-methylcytosine-specific restriction endonuclease McrA